MATAFTHAFVGASLSLLAPPALPRRRLALLMAAAAALPDLDVIGFHYGVAYADVFGHRGFTHSLFFAALVGVGGALAVARHSGGRAFAACALLLAVATASHGFLDALTDAGLGVGFFAPFSARRFFFPFRPLATSPLEVKAFFSGPALAILANEMLWVWLPVGAAILITRGVGRARPRRNDASASGG